MIEFELDTHVLGNTVFAFSPLAETVGSLRLLTSASPDPVHRPWLRAVGARLRSPELIAAVELLVLLSPGDSKWAPSFFYPPVRSPVTSIDEQLHELSGLSASNLRSDLTDFWADSSEPALVQGLLDLGADAGKSLADAVYQYWSYALAPFWRRIVGVLEEDVAYRAEQTLQRGLFELLRDLHPRISLVGERLRLDMPAHNSATYGRAHLTLIPSVFVWPGLIVTHEVPGHFELTYGSRGTAKVWEGLHEAARERQLLGSLLGRTRARVLRMLSVPRSTTDLARELGQSAASINKHLTVLRDSGLALSWRTGRVVLYEQTPLGRSLVELNAGDTETAKDSRIVVAGLDGVRRD